MKSNYQRVFDAVGMQPEQQERIRATLSAQYSARPREDTSAGRKMKRPRILIVAAVVVLLLALVGFTFGSQIIQLLGGGSFETNRHTLGNASVSMSSGFETDPVEIHDNQIIFTLDGSNRNITDQCSAETYYQYETMDETGNRHVVLIGGTPDNVGWAEFVWTGGASASNATYHEDVEPAWLVVGKAALSRDFPVNQE